MANSSKKTRKESPQASVQEGRRKLFKTIVLGGGALGLTKWSKPIVSSIILPAHAQATGGPAAPPPAAPASCVTSVISRNVQFQVGVGGAGVSQITLILGGNPRGSDTVDGASQFTINQSLGTQIGGPGFDWSGTVNPGVVGVANIVATTCGYAELANGTTVVRTAGFVAPKTAGGGGYGGLYTAGVVAITVTIGNTGDPCLAVAGGPGGAPCI